MKTISTSTPARRHGQPERRLSLSRRQQGVVLFIALIVLVAMTLAGIAMVRSVDTALGIAGNMAFKESTVQGADNGISVAFTWLTNNGTGTTLQNDNLASGYHSAQPSYPEPNWFDSASWGTNNTVAINSGNPDSSGNTVRYIIHRMCTLSGTAYNGTSGGVSNQCAISSASGTGSGGSQAVGAPQFVGVSYLSYRITTRVDGPRNTVSIIQTFVVIQA